MLLRLPQFNNRPLREPRTIPDDASIIGIDDIRLLKETVLKCTQLEQPPHIYCCDPNPEIIPLAIPRLQGIYPLTIDGISITLSLGRPSHEAPSIVWLTSKPEVEQKKPLPYYSFPQNQTPRQVDIIGAGISGLATAYVLAQKGIRVRIFDQHEQPCQEASGNPHALVYANLSPFDQIQPRFYLSSMFTGIHALSSFSQDVFHSCGILCSNKHHDHWKNIILDEEKHIQQRKEGLWLPRAGVVHPKSLAQAILSHPRITWFPNHEVTHIESQGGTPSFFANGVQWNSEHLIICTAHQLSKLSVCDTISVRKSSGQLSYTKAPLHTNFFAYSDHAYLTPFWKGHQCFGATYHLHDVRTEVCNEDHQDNLKRLTSSHPSIDISTKDLLGRCGIRAQTNNFLPIVGPLPNKDWYTTKYAKLKDGLLRSSRYPPAKYIPNISVHVGHGSKGFSQAWLCAEIIAAQLTHRPIPVDTDVYQALHPARFLVRELHKKKKQI